MKFKVFSFVVFLMFIYQLRAAELGSLPAYENKSASTGLNIDSLVQNALSDTASKPTEKKAQTKVITISKSDLEELSNRGLVRTSSLTPTTNTKISSTDSISLQKTEDFKIDSILLLANPFFIELVYNGLSNKEKPTAKTDLKALIYGKKVQLVSNQPTDKQTSLDEIIVQLRNEARDQITRNAANLYIMSFDQLPDPGGNSTRFIARKPITNVEFENEDEVPIRTRRLVVKNPQLGPWQYKVNSLAQFSESVISANWYQGGNSNLAVLGILNGQLSYDDKKNIQWDNSAEWRMGFVSITDQTNNKFYVVTNDDVLKINSKLGIKAGGNFFYSGSVDCSTQFFNAYKGIDFINTKGSFLTPIRLSINGGLDYKYKKIWSLLVSPISYKFIYLNNPLVDPNLFGIKTGENKLSEIGSSLKVIYSNQVTPNIQLDSKFLFYTNYQKVEIDWEIVANMTINRFLSTRISFNPRYDNTIIEKDGSVAKLQFKQFLSVGFSHKFL